MTYSLLPSLYVCYSKSDCRLSVTSTKERERERERKREAEKSVTKNESRQRKRRSKREREREDKETIKKKVVVVDTFFILHLHTIYKSLYFSPFPSFFSSLFNIRRESEKRNHNEHQMTCKVVLVGNQNNVELIHATLYFIIRCKFIAMND